jgi:hypothetical protein
VSGGAHGLQPDGHEHVRCRFCRRSDVHTVTRGDGQPVYDAHDRPGSTVKCMTSRNQLVLAEDRHRPAPGGRP